MRTSTPSVQEKSPANWELARVEQVLAREPFAIALGGRGIGRACMHTDVRREGLVTNDDFHQNCQKNMGDHASSTRISRRDQTCEARHQLPAASSGPRQQPRGRMHQLPTFADISWGLQALRLRSCARRRLVSVKLSAFIVSRCTLSAPGADQLLPLRASCTPAADFSSQQISACC